MRGRLATLLGVTLCLSLVAASCAEDQPAIQSQGGSGDAQAEHEDQGEGHEDEGTKEIAGQRATYHGTTDVGGSSDFQLELDDFYFGPTILDGDAGQELALGLHNEGGVPHTFTIDGVVDEELPSGADGIEIQVTFPDSGALVFYCRFHRAQGMVGALSVDGSLEAPAGEGDSDSVYG